LNSRKFVHMFFQTLLIGWLAGLITSFVVYYSVYATYLSPFDGKELLGLFLFYSGKGLVYTVIAQTGFFAYLFINMYGRNFFRSFWPAVQLLIIAFVLFDIVYFTSKSLSLTFRLGLMFAILIGGLIIAFLKVRETNRTAFVPALFVMIVILTLELSLVLRTGEKGEIMLMLVPIFVATAFQLMRLHHVTKVDPEHQKRIEERRRKRLEMQKQRMKEKEAKQKAKGKGKERSGEKEKKASRKASPQQKNKNKKSSKKKQANNKRA